MCHLNWSSKSHRSQASQTAEQNFSGIKQLGPRLRNISQLAQSALEKWRKSQGLSSALPDAFKFREQLFARFDIRLLAVVNWGLLGLPHNACCGVSTELLLQSLLVVLPSLIDDASLTRRE